jgi:hypothetical protein
LGGGIQLGCLNVFFSNAPTKNGLEAKDGVFVSVAGELVRYEALTVVERPLCDVWRQKSAVRL